MLSYYGDCDIMKNCIISQIYFSKLVWYDMDARISLVTYQRFEL